MAVHRINVKDAVVTVGPLRVPLKGFAEDKFITLSPEAAREFVWTCTRCHGHPVIFGMRCWRCGQPARDDHVHLFFAVENGISENAALAAAIEFRCTRWDMPTCVERIRWQERNR